MNCAQTLRFYHNVRRQESISKYQTKGEFHVF